MSDPKIADKMAPHDSELADTTTLNGLPNDEEKAEVESPPPEKVPAAPQIPPEEGLRGWMCITGAFFSIMASFGFLNAYVSSYLYRKENGLTFGTLTGSVFSKLITKRPF